MNTSIDKILEKYWNGQSSLEEEKLLQAYFNSGEVHKEHTPYSPLFQFLNEERSIQLGETPDITSRISSQKSKIIRFRIPQIMAIAASMLVLVAVGMHLFKADDTMYKNKYTELQDPEEALAITLDALGFLGKKYESGSQPMTKYMKNFEQTAIVKFN